MHQDQNDIIFKWSSPPNMNSSEVCITSMSHTKEIPTIMSGWLFKMRRKNAFYTPTWDKRWVVIQNDSISWRHSKSSEVAGSIDLFHVERIYKVESLKNSKKENKGNMNSIKNDNVDRIFVIKSKKRTLCLMTRKEERCDKWIRAVQLQLDLRNGGTFSGPRNEKNQRKRIKGGDKYEVMMRALDQNLMNLSEFGTYSERSMAHSTGGSSFDPRDFRNKLGSIKSFSKETTSDQYNRSFESSRFHSIESERSLSFQLDQNTSLSDLLCPFKEEDIETEAMILV